MSPVGTALRAFAHPTRHLRAVAQRGCAFLLGAMGAAEDRVVLLDAVTDDADAAVIAGRRERMDRAFEAVERMGVSVHRHLERLVVIVAAGFASGHGCLACRFVGLQNEVAKARGGSATSLRVAA